MQQSNLKDDEIIRYMEKAIYDMALVDIYKARSVNANMAAFILCASLIDTMGKFLRGCTDKNCSGFDEFVELYLAEIKEKYGERFVDTEKKLCLWEEYRCGLIHGYTGGKKYIYGQDEPQNHLKEFGLDFHDPEIKAIKEKPEATFLDLDIFISDIRQAINDYFVDLKNKVVKTGSSGNQINLMVNASRRFKAYPLIVHTTEYTKTLKS